MQAPVLVLNTNTKRESGRKVQIANVQAAMAVADIIRSTLGPRSMLKMILDPMGGIVLTNDGNCILREIDVSHPSAKSMIELSRTQDEEVGDGTTSVIILAGEFLSASLPFLNKNMHPRVIVGAYVKALDACLESLDEQKVVVDLDDNEKLLSLVKNTLGTKFMSRFGDEIAQMAINAVKKVTVVNANNKKEIDIKRYARVEKIPGGFLEDSGVLNGLMLNKDVIHPKMDRKKINPRIILLDSPLEYKKGESQTNIEISKADDWDAILKAEEDFIEELCTQLIRHKPDVIFTEKGVSDLAQHYLSQAGISVIRRIRKTDNNRIARAVGATIVNEPSQITEEDIGKQCGLFEVKKIGDEYFTYLLDCEDPKACTIVLRGASRDVLNEMERNLHDAMGVVKTIALNPAIVPGGGACEMAIGKYIAEKAKLIDGVEQYPFKAIGEAFEVIPKTLIENCGGSTIRLLTKLRVQHADSDKPSVYGIDGNKGEIANMEELNIWDPYAVKTQTIKTAIESACLLLRIDDICSGLKDRNAYKPKEKPQQQMPEGVQQA